MYIPLENNYQVVRVNFELNSEGLPPRPFFYNSPQAVIYELPPTNSPTTPDTPVSPLQPGSLSASVFVTQDTPLFEMISARNTIYATQYAVGGETVDFSIDQFNVAFTTPGQWGDISLIEFSGDAYDLQDKLLSFSNFAAVSIDMFDFPPYASLPKLGLNTAIEGAENAIIVSTSVNDTIRIAHTDDGYGPGIMIISTQAGDDSVFIQPSLLTYSVGGFDNDNSGDNIITLIDMGEGNDQFNSALSNSQDNVSLGSGDDIAMTGGGDDVIYGDEGNDFIDGGAGDDCIEGGEGDDQLLGGDGDDCIAGGSGNDHLLGMDGDDILFGDDDNDILEGGQGNNSLDGGAGDDTLIVNAGETGFNQFKGGTGADTILATTTADIRLSNEFDSDNSIENIQGQAGTNQILGQNGVDNEWNFTTTSITGIASIVSGDGNDKIVGSLGSDVIKGMDGNDEILANDGNDTIEGGNGINTLDGGRGNDKFIFNAGETSVNTIYGGTGVDLIEAKTNATVFLSDSFSASNSIESIVGLGGTNNIQGQDGVDENWNFSSTTLTGIDAIQTGSGTDTVVGSTGNDTIEGGAGNDNIQGNSGNDVIYGNGDNDTLRGNNGNDYIYGGDGNDTIYGDNDDDIIEGGNGTNTLNGGEGDDTFIVNAGETGLNTFNGGTGTDQIEAAANATIFLNTTFSATNSIESIVGLGGINNIQGRDGIGENWNFSSTTLTGIDAIRTGSGNDTVVGSTGNDTIEGGTGNDTIRGNEGDDIIYGNENDDRLFGDAGNDTISDGTGNDRSDGGANIDTAILRYDFSVYTRSFNMTTKVLTLKNSVSGTETDTFVNFEFYNFNGVEYAFNDTTGVFTPVVPPVALDLNGDGVNYSDQPLMIDIDSDGQLEAMHWVGQDDGVLVYDKNADGLISDQSEISFVGYQAGSRTDLEGLRAFDSNQNNQLDNQDAEWQRFGVVQNNQFLTLDELNIQSINLYSDNQFQRLSDGVTEYGQGVYTKTDGSTGITADVSFAYQEIDIGSVLHEQTEGLNQLMDALPNAATPPPTAPATAAEAVTALAIPQPAPLEPPPTDVL